MRYKENIMKTSQKVMCAWLVLSATSEALAGGTSIELAPQIPGQVSPPSCTVHFDVILHNMEGHVLEPRLITLDFSATDAALALPATFNWNLDLANGMALYTRFNAMPKVDAVYSSPAPVPGFMISIPDSGSEILGTIVVDLPADVGSYTLDAMNALAPDTNTGGRIDYGFDVRTTLHTLNHNLGGGTTDVNYLYCIPEPASAVLFVTTGAGLICRRRIASRVQETD